MKPPSRQIILVITAILLSASADAQMSLGERLVSSLSYCDARLFDELNASRGELDRRAQVIARGRAATFPMSDMAHDTESKKTSSRCRWKCG